MKLAIDLHIHSGLSPCADDDMTPNNILRMAKIKDLDVIAITDHNSTRNLKSFLKVAKKHNIICIPGVEVNTKEEVHLLALFKDIDASNKFQHVLDDTLPKIKNNSRIFGHQYIYDENDNIIEEYENMLLNAINLPLRETIDEILKLDGIPIPAHVDRKSFSIISNLGFIAPELPIDIIELSKNCKYDDLITKYPYLKKYNIIKSSDAHSLGNIMEREFFIDVKNKNTDETLKSIKN
ncbi:MAG: PHP domain-containing protein [Clostridiales bacterium]|nr:PHP domain-containing protein [Clostridiales bacterium]